MRAIRSIGLTVAANVLAALSGCGILLGDGLDNYRTLTAAEDVHLKTYMASTGDNVDPALKVLGTQRGYSAPLFGTGDKTGSRFYLKPCGELSQQDCSFEPPPTIDTPTVVVYLKDKPVEDGTFEFSGKFHLVYPNAKDGNKENRLVCKLQEGSTPPAGAKVGPSGLWTELLTRFREIGTYFTAQKYYDGMHVEYPSKHTKAMSDGSTFECHVSTSG